MGLFNELLKSVEEAVTVLVPESAEHKAERHNEAYREGQEAAQKDGFIGHTVEGLSDVFETVNPIRPTTEYLSERQGYKDYLQGKRTIPKRYEPDQTEPSAASDSSPTTDEFNAGRASDFESKFVSAVQRYVETTHPTTILKTIGKTALWGAAGLLILGALSESGSGRDSGKKEAKPEKKSKQVLVPLLLLTFYLISPS